MYGINVYNSYYDGENDFAVSSEVYDYLLNVNVSSNNGSNLVIDEAIKNVFKDVEEEGEEVESVFGSYL